MPTTKITCPLPRQPVGSPPSSNGNKQAVSRPITALIIKRTDPTIDPSPLFAAQ